MLARDNLLVVGSIAFDDIAHHGRKPRFNELGGAATHFAISASPFHRHTRLIGVVGTDFQSKHYDLFNEHGVNTLEVTRTEGTTFRWGGSYEADMNRRTTIYTRLGVFEDFNPIIPIEWRTTKFVFLANIHPRLQRTVFDQMRNPTFVAIDTMNLWIETERDELLLLFKHVNAVFVSDQEAAQLTGKHTIASMGAAMLDLCPGVVVIKRGEHGAYLFTRQFTYYVPAYPVPEVVDPTGAGDSFAGGFMGMIASRGQIPTPDTLRAAMLAGSAMASFCVGDYGVAGTAHKTFTQMDARYQQLVALTRPPTF